MADGGVPKGLSIGTIGPGRSEIAAPGPHSSAAPGRAAGTYSFPLSAITSRKEVAVQEGRHP